jgi:hypothetical protein
VLAVNHLGREILGRKLEHNIILKNSLLFPTSRFKRSKVQKIKRSPEIIPGFFNASRFFNSGSKTSKNLFGLPDGGP